MNTKDILHEYCLFLTKEMKINIKFDNIVMKQHCLYYRHSIDLTLEAPAGDMSIAIYNMLSRVQTQTGLKTKKLYIILVYKFFWPKCNHKEGKLNYSRSSY